MQKPWELFEHLDEIVYVTDIDSYEIEYMNEFALQVYGYESLAQVKGKKCHEILQGKSESCSVCTNQQLKPSYFNECKYYNPFIKKHLLSKNTLLELDGKRYRMEIAIDMHIQEEQQKTIDNMMFTESMINEGLRRALAEQNAIRSIEIFMEYLGQQTQSDRVYIFEEQKKGFADNTFEWCADGVTAEKDNLQEIPLEDVHVWYDSFEKQQNVILSNLEDIRFENPEVYKYLEPQGIQSLVVGPLISDSKIIGFYGVDNPPAKLLNHISDMAWIVGHFIVSMLKKRDLVDRLEQLSYCDQLTGLRNRHALREILSSGGVNKNIGIMYGDIMGLKRVNDIYGHEEGDKLILKTSKCLKNHFRAIDLYRIGGDEFLVLCCNMPEHDFYARIEALRRDMTDSHALMAIGCLWKSEADDLDALISAADTLMYQEKQSYYANKDPKEIPFNFPEN